jgi:hypothetical protein
VIRWSSSHRSAERETGDCDNRVSAERCGGWSAFVICGDDGSKGWDIHLRRRGSGSVYDLVFSPDKEQKFIYMIDAMNGEVRIVDRASKETLDRFGRPGRQIGQFTALHNIAVDRQGNIFTSEVNTGQRVQKLRRLDMQN